MNKRSILRSLFLMLAIMAAGVVTAQPGRIYKSLDEVTNPDDVYILRLRGKRLKTVPSVVFKMTNLRELDLRGNRLTSLPDSIAQLRHLEKLEVSRNPLSVLPNEMSQMSQLRELILWDTYMVDFPATFEMLDSTLEVLDLRSCPIHPDEQEAIAKMLPSVKKLWDQACNCGY